MTMATVIRDKDGRVINIGEWDYMIEEAIDEKTGAVIQIINNPMPDGVTSSTEEIVILEDGGRAAKQ